MGTPGECENLLEAALAGDEQAREQLFSHLRARILRVVQRRVWSANREGSENLEEAQDLTQKICVIIFKKFETPDFRAHLIPSVFAVTRNKIGEYYREKGRRQRREAEVTQEGILLGVPDGSPGQEEQVLGKELEVITRRALKKLKDPCRAIAKAFLEGRIKEYVAERLRTTRPGTVYSQIRRCRQEFCRLLRAEGWEG